jgi:hypothetical protein
MRPCGDEVSSRENEVEPDDGHVIPSKFLKPEDRRNECDNERSRQDTMHQPLGLVLLDTIDVHKTLYFVSKIATAIHWELGMLTLIVSFFASKTGFAHLATTVPYKKTHRHPFTAEKKSQAATHVARSRKKFRIHAALESKFEYAAG